MWLAPVTGLMDMLPANILWDGKKPDTQRAGGHKSSNDWGREKINLLREIALGGGGNPQSPIGNWFGHE